MLNTEKGLIYSFTYSRFLNSHSHMMERVWTNSDLVALTFRRQDEKTTASCNASCPWVTINSVWKNKGSEGLEWRRGNQRKECLTFRVSLLLYQEGDGVSSVQISWFSCSVVSDSLWPPLTAARQASLSITNSQSPPKPMSIESVMPSNHVILCHPLLLLPSIFPSIRVFSSESTLRITWPKYWSFSFSISPSNEHPGLISFRMDWLVLLAVQGTLKSLLQHHSSKASILRHSDFFTVQLSHPYMTTGKPKPWLDGPLLAK